MRWNEIAASNFERRQSDLVSRLVQQAFDDVIALGTARAPVDIYGRGIGEDGLRRQVHGWDIVCSRSVAQRIHKRCHTCSDDVGSHSVQCMRSDRENRSSGIERQLGHNNLIASMMIAEQRI